MQCIFEKFDDKRKSNLCFLFKGVEIEDAPVSDSTAIYFFTTWKLELNVKIWKLFADIWNWLLLIMLSRLRSKFFVWPNSSQLWIHTSTSTFHMTTISLIKIFRNNSYFSPQQIPLPGGTFDTCPWSKGSSRDTKSSPLRWWRDL